MWVCANCTHSRHADEECQECSCQNYEARFLAPLAASHGTAYSASYLAGRAHAHG